MNKDYSDSYIASGVWSDSDWGAYSLYINAPIPPHQYDLYDVTVTQVTYSNSNATSTILTTDFTFSASIDKNGQIRATTTTSNCAGRLGRMHYTLTKK